MVHQKGAIRCYDLEKKRFVHQLDFLKDQLKPDDRVVLKILDNGDFWLMWDRGVGYYDVYNKKWNQISGIQLGHYSWFTSMDVDKGGNAWVGTVIDGFPLLSSRHLSSSYCTALFYSCWDDNNTFPDSMSLICTISL